MVEETPAPGAQDAALQMRVLAQYLKDMSFENPNAPEALRPSETAPAIDVNVDVGARRLGDTEFEVELRCSANAKRGEDTSFIVEVVYAGVFQIQNAPDTALQPLLLIECPRLLFPFVRRLVADATRDGGYPPLMLDPIDFANLYRRQMAAAQAAEEASPEGENQVN